MISTYALFARASFYIKSQRNPGADLVFNMYRLTPLRLNVITCFFHSRNAFHQHMQLVQL